MATTCNPHTTNDTLANRQSAVRRVLGTTPLVDCTSTTLRAATVTSGITGTMLEGLNAAQRRVVLDRFLGGKPLGHGLKYPTTVEPTPAPATTAPTAAVESAPAPATTPVAAPTSDNPLDLVKTAFAKCTTLAEVAVLVDASTLEARTAMNRIGKPAATPAPVKPAAPAAPKPAAEQPKPVPAPTPVPEKAPRTGEAILASLEAGRESITGLKKPEMTILAGTLGVDMAAAANWPALRKTVSTALKGRKEAAKSKPAPAAAPAPTGKPSEAVQGLLWALREELAGNVDALAALELVAEAASR